MTIGNNQTSKIHSEVISSNNLYKDSFTKGELPIFPGRKFAILTCMDARLDPAKFAGLNEGDAHIVRNAGGRASEDAIRSLVISHKLLGTNEWFVIQHTNCGMELFTNEIMASLLEGNLDTATFDGQEWRNNEASGNSSSKPGTTEGHDINWLTFKGLHDTVKHDVLAIQSHPLVSDAISVYGYIYEVESGSLIPVT